MSMNDLPQGEKYIRSHRFHKRWHKVLMVLGSVVVFCTTYALILPAITMERGCQIPEHTHTDACYTQVSSVRKMVPVCTPETLEIHQHTADCYDASGEVSCGYADFVVHTHDAECYDENGVLWCPLPEIRTHEHTEACYAQVGGELICGHEESDGSDGHMHNEDCYGEDGELQCPLSESEAVDEHHHTDDCYAEEHSELSCGRAEVILHRHVATCYDENGGLICGKMQVLQHQHSDACFEAVEVSVDADVLTCTIPEEDGGHQHTARCYGVWELTCGLEEHTHTEACKTAGLTEEEQAQVDEVIAQIDTLPTREEITEILNSFEATGDDDGYSTYLTEITVKAKVAYKAYEALTEDQKAKVTNADKLMALEFLWSSQTLESGEALTSDAARVSGISITSIADGTGPFDSDDTTGNDSSAENRIVRTFDTVTYQFEVQMDAYASESFSEARVKLEFVLPLTADQAVFDQTAMAWMDQTAGYAPTLTTETRTIDGIETECQVLTCYKWLLPSTGHQSVVPGSFGENVTINVKSMKNGDTFAPIFSAAMEHGTWDGVCAEHNQEEKASAAADKITVSAAPKYNIRIGCDATYKSSFDFNSGNGIAQAYGSGYGKGQVTGRIVKYGIVVQLYNSNASRGLKGIELPDGSDITFDLKVSSEYTINMPNTGDGYSQGQ